MVTKKQIHQLTQKIIVHFHPLRVILFGSYGYGEPDEYSDVDLLIILSSVENRLRKAGEIHQAVFSGFPLDVIVYSEQSLNERLLKEDFFLREIIQKGRLLYEAPHA